MTAPARRAAYEALRAIESGRALLAEAIVASREPPVGSKIGPDESSATLKPRFALPGMPYISRSP